MSGSLWSVVVAHKRHVFYVCTYSYIHVCIRSRCMYSTLKPTSACLHNVITNKGASPPSSHNPISVPFPGFSTPWRATRQVHESIAHSAWFSDHLRSRDTLVTITKRGFWDIFIVRKRRLNVTRDPLSVMCRYHVKSHPRVKHHSVTMVHCVT